MTRTITRVYTQSPVKFTNQLGIRKFSRTALLLMERKNSLSNILNPVEADNNITTGQIQEPDTEKAESVKSESIISDGFGYRAKSVGEKSAESDHSLTDDSIKEVSMEYKHAHYFLRSAMSAKDIDLSTFNWTRILRSLDYKYHDAKKDYLPHRDDKGFTWHSLKRPGMRPDIPWVSEKDPIPWSETRRKWNRTVDWSETDLSSSGADTLDKDTDLSQKPTLALPLVQEQAASSSKRERSFDEIEEWNKRVRRESETSSTGGTSANKGSRIFTNESALEQFNLSDIFSINSDILVYITYIDIVLYSTILLLIVYLCYSYIINWRYIPTPLRLMVDVFIFSLFIRLLISCFVSEYLITRFDGAEHWDQFFQDNTDIKLEELYSNITYYLVIILISISLVMISRINFNKTNISILYIKNLILSFKQLLDKIIKKLTVLGTIYSKTFLLFYLLSLYSLIIPEEMWQLLIEIIKSYFNC